MYILTESETHHSMQQRCASGPWNSKKQSAQRKIFVRTIMYLFEVTQYISSVLRMDMDGQKASSINPCSQPAEAGSSVSGSFLLAAVGLKNCCPLHCAVCSCQLCHDLSHLQSICFQGRASQHEMLISTGTVVLLQFRLYTKKPPAGLGLYL